MTPFLAAAEPDLPLPIASDPPIRVGVLGVHPTRGGAARAQLPALQALPEYALTALSNRHPDLAQAAGQAFGVAQVFDTTEALVSSPAVDLVAVTAKVPAHQELVTAALQAGKNVYCEWPLGNGLAEAESLAALAHTQGVHGAIGLQARAVPAIQYVRDLLRHGYLGEVLSTTLVGAGAIYGATIEQANAYTVDARNGAGMLYTILGSGVDALCYCLGEFDYLAATATNRRRTTTVIETGEVIPMTAFDQIAVHGVLQSGAVAAVHYRGGPTRGTNLRWEINGTAGDLIITADGGHFGIFPLTIWGRTGEGTPLEVLAVPDHYTWVPPGTPAGPAFAVAQNYRRLAHDLQHGTHLSPTFDDALVRQRMLHAIEQSAATGTRQTYL